METKEQDKPTWSFYKKISFRFIFTLVFLFIALNNNGAFPFWDSLVSPLLEGPLHTLIPWIGKHILHLPYNITIFTNGSGDTTYDYVLIFSITLVSFFLTLIWTLLDRNRTNYQIHYYWLTTAIRFYLALMLFHYGMIKVIKLQFPSPEIFRLSETIGDLSPMGLAWTYLGYSDGYNFFIGMAEIASLLLLFRRTMSLGAIITLATASNIMAVNYFYDIPVKILSTALVIMTLFLLMNDIVSLFKFFILGQSTSLSEIKSPSFKRKWVNKIKIVFKFLIIGYSLIYGIFNIWSYKNEQKDPKNRAVLYGLYDIETYKIKNDSLSNSFENISRWHQIIIEDDDFIRVRYSGDSVTGFLTTLDTIAKTLEFKNRTDTTLRGFLKYTLTNQDKYLFSGTINGDSAFLIANKRKIKPSDYRLIKRGFHWINERPFNK